MEILISVVGVLVGVVGVLFGALQSKSKENKILKHTAEEQQQTIKKNNEITEVLSKPAKNENSKNFKKGTSGKIKFFIILFMFQFFLYGCSLPTYNSKPKLFIIEKPKELEEKTQKYDFTYNCYNDLNTCSMTQDEFIILLEIVDFLTDAYEKYTRQVEIYNSEEVKWLNLIWFII